MENASPMHRFVVFFCKLKVGTILSSIIVGPALYSLEYILSVSRVKREWSLFRDGLGAGMCGRRFRKVRNALKNYRGQLWGGSNATSRKENQ